MAMKKIFDAGTEILDIKSTTVTVKLNVFSITFMEFYYQRAAKWCYNALATTQKYLL